MVVGLLFYVVFSYIKGVNGIEEMILFVFIGFCVLCLLFWLINIVFIVELIECGVVYCGDFKLWNEIKKIELKKLVMMFFL